MGVLSIPAITVLNVLIRSCQKGIGKRVIHWNNGVMCTDETRPMKDGVTAVLWPKIYDIKMVLWKNKKLREEKNVELLIAMICDNSESLKDDLKDFLENNKNEGKLKKLNLEVKSRLIDLSLNMSRVRPFTERIPSVFGYDYEGVEISDDEIPEILILPESRTG